MQVGAAWRASGVPRSDLFLATKLSVESYGAMEARVQVIPWSDDRAATY